MSPHVAMVTYNCSDEMEARVFVIFDEFSNNNAFPNHSAITSLELHCVAKNQWERRLKLSFLKFISDILLSSITKLTFVHNYWLTVVIISLPACQDDMHAQQLRLGSTQYYTNITMLIGSERTKYENNIYRISHTVAWPKGLSLIWREQTCWIRP